jgi:NitT/TauT family transport system substrate-binding protein
MYDENKGDFEMMKKSNWLRIFVLTLVLSLVLVGCGKKEAAAPASPAKPAGAAGDQVLITEAFHSLLYLPLYVARDKGFFEKNNIRVSAIRAAGSGPTALASVLSGEAQFSVHGPEHVAFAKAKGGETRALSAVANSAPVWVLAKKGVTIKSPQDFKGKKIVVGLAPTTSNTLFRKLLIDHKIDAKTDLTITEVQNGSELGPVLANQADVAIVYEPQADQGVAQGLEVVYDFTKIYPDFAFSTTNTSLKLIKEKPELVTRFVKAMEESLAYIHANPAEAQAVARKEFPNMSPDVVNKAVKRMIDSNVYLPKGLVTESAYKSAIEVQKFIGNLKTDIPYGDIVDPSFTKK